MLALLIAVLLPLDVSAAVMRRAAPSPDRVAVSIHCVRLVDELSLELTIRREGAGFVDDGGRRIAASLVEEVVSLMHEPTGGPQSLATLHVDRSVVLARAESLMAEWRLPSSKRIELRRRMSEPGFFDGIVVGHFPGHVMDHGCDTNVEITTGTRSVTASSRSDDPFGVPWTIDGRRSWNIRLGGAIGSLLPADFAFKKEQFLTLGFVDSLAEEWVRRAAAPH